MQQGYQQQQQLYQSRQQQLAYQNQHHHQQQQLETQLQSALAGIPGIPDALHALVGQAIAGRGVIGTYFCHSVYKRGGNLLAHHTQHPRVLTAWG
jgi:hypothetical protein